MNNTRQKPPKPLNMSQLDYLWTYFGGYGVSNVPSETPQEDVILTEDAVVKLIKATSGSTEGISKLIYRNHPSNPDLVQLVGTNIEGEELTIADMPKEIHVNFFGKSVVTSADIDLGCPYPIGTNVLLLTLTNDERFYFNLDTYVGLKGSETDSINTSINNGVIKSDLKTQNSDTIKFGSSSDGVYAEVKINNTDEGVDLEKSENGLSASIPFKGTTSKQKVKFHQLTLASYLTLENKVPGTIYFITDYPYIYLNEVRYGVDIRPGEVPIVSLVYDKDHMLLSYKKADGSDIQHIHLGPVDEEFPGMLTSEDYREFKNTSDALYWKLVNN